MSRISNNNNLVKNKTCVRFLFAEMIPYECTCVQAHVIVWCTCSTVLEVRVVLMSDVCRFCYVKTRKTQTLKL